MQVEGISGQGSRIVLPNEIIRIPDTGIHTVCAVISIVTVNFVKKTQ